ncbi:MAG: HdeA/HdeB family chaperone [Amaricoccus sp.]
MKLILALALAAGTMAAPALAQESKTLLCKDYAKLDNAGKMAILAELQSMNSEMASGQTVSSEELATSLNTECAKDPDKLVQDAMKEIHKM